VSEVNSDPEVLAAALLHDVVEDCGVSVDELAASFGPKVAALVATLTNDPNAGNRVTRKALEVECMKSASVDAKTIKLADFLHNAPSIIEHDAHFAPVYMREKRALVEVLSDGDPTLFAKANELLTDYFTNRPVNSLRV